MEKQLHIPAEDIPALSSQFYMQFGTTLAGLVVCACVMLVWCLYIRRASANILFSYCQAHGHVIDYDHWHQHVHGTLPYDLVTHNEPLRALLSQINLPLYVFTNADDKHAAICLERMGIADLFRDVITFERIQEMGMQRGKVHHGVPVVCKPARMAFELALQVAGGAHPHNAVFFDDSARNVASAASMGIYSVLVWRGCFCCSMCVCVFGTMMGFSPSKHPQVGRVGANSGADAEVLSLLDLPTAAPELWQQLTHPTHQAVPLPSLRELPAPPELTVESRQVSETMPILMRRLSMERSGSGGTPQYLRADAWGEDGGVAARDGG